MKKEIKNSNNKQTIYKKCCLIVCSAKKKKKKKTESKNPNVLSAKNGRIMLLSKCASYV